MHRRDQHGYSSPSGQEGMVRGPGYGRGRGRGGRGPGRHGRGGRRRSRASRGQVRNTILVLLAEEPMHGYQIMQELDERTGGAWHPSPGSIYPTLQQLADEGLIEGRAADGKNVFSLSGVGREAVEALDEPPAWERFDGEGMGDVVGLRRSVGQFNAALRQISASGSELQVAEARQIVNRARKSLYRLLAEED